MSSQRVKVTIPASTANLGPGFDALGMAFQLYSVVEMEISDRTTVELVGKELEGTPADKSNLLYQVAASLFQEAGLAVPELAIRASSEAPLTRGLGSSAAAIVGALVAANQLAGEPFSREQLFARATALEGHPDNVGASLFGGIIVATMPETIEEPVPYVRFSPPAGLQTLVVIPDFMLETTKARNVLPQVYSKEDVVYNVGHSSLLVAALAQGRLDLMGRAMSDRLHQPYRAKLVPGLNEILDKATEHGAVGAALSGAGPTILCFFSSAEEEGQLRAFVDRVMKGHGIAYRVMILQPDENGVQVEIHQR
ncbi:MULTISPECIES: homoserine kinase [Brevibacillus]|jgi:homoserine kinase|uniref:homoserine kinase n=1 Tax=Brevibacillus TaxID=55080 RepID=UPI00156B4705|nr:MULTISPECIES: homoserine kinase [Brevibacillus]MBU8714808.1 homoserine kinase [Brevibacillus parabrevis]MDH6348771.1 homoserine kinase [Brevibacillus sp. 1238]MDR5000666.1 homoserine kinase [Brevibacillus parabrevis]MED2253228.1 homoserine kinase [Brevibacillus parabrevis]UED70907.1 homoserine kinase [Brevibacillus sp. HD3.3A]